MNYFKNSILYCSVLFVFHRHVRCSVTYSEGSKLEQGCPGVNIYGRKWRQSERMEGSYHKLYGAGVVFFYSCFLKDLWHHKFVPIIHRQHIYNNNSIISGRGHYMKVLFLYISGTKYKTETNHHPLRCILYTWRDHWEK